MEWKLIHSTNDNAEAMVIESMLKSEGIECRVTKETIGKLDVISSGDLGAIKIYVLEEFAEEAKALLETTN